MNRGSCNVNESSIIEKKTRAISVPVPPSAPPLNPPIGAGASASSEVSSSPPPAEEPAPPLNPLIIRAKGSSPTVTNSGVPRVPHNSNEALDEQKAAPTEKPSIINKIKDAGNICMLVSAAAIGVTSPISTMVLGASGFLLAAGAKVTTMVAILYASSALMLAPLGIGLALVAAAGLAYACKKAYAAYSGKSAEENVTNNTQQGLGLFAKPVTPETSAEAQVPPSEQQPKLEGMPFLGLPS